MICSPENPKCFISLSCSASGPPTPFPSWTPTLSHPSRGPRPGLLDCCVSLGKTGQLPLWLPRPRTSEDTMSRQHGARGHLAGCPVAPGHPASMSPTLALGRSQRRGTQGADGQDPDWSQWTARPLASLQRQDRHSQTERVRLHITLEIHIFSPLGTCHHHPLTLLAPTPPNLRIWCKFMSARRDNAWREGAGLTLSLKVCLPCLKKTQEETGADVINICLYS